LAQCNFYREEEYDQVFADRLEKLKIFLKDDKVSVLSDDTRTYSLAETKDLVQELEKLKGQIDLSSLTRILHLTHFEHDLLPSCLGQCREIVLNEWANKDRILYLLNTLLTQLQNLNETEKLRDIRMVELSRHLHHKYLMDAQAKIIASVEEYKENLSNFFPKDKNSLWNYLNSINYSFNNTLIPQFISQQHNTLSSDLKLPAFLIGLSSSPESTTANIAIMYSMLQRSFNDAYNFNDNTITVSLFSLFFGPDIIFHELAHSIETYFISDSASNDFRQRLSAISNCVAQLHTGYGHQYLDEDMADTISAYFGNTAFSPHCQMFDQITLTLSPSPQDTHSSDFFRLIYTNFIKGNYPPSCKRVVESDPGHHMKKCI
jgi:hypothetical protein